MNGPEPVHQLYGWIVHYADGGEQIALVGTFPLITTSEAVARELMGVAARRVLDTAKRATPPGVRVTLRTFEWNEPDGRG